MKLLLDTSTFIWASCEPARLSQVARKELSDPFNKRFVSVASVWEMQIKHALGKLPLADRVESVVDAWIRPLQASFLPIEIGHIACLYKLSPVHRDPFDRILIAQAMSEEMTILSPDRSFRLYETPLVW